MNYRTIGRCAATLLAAAIVPLAAWANTVSVSPGGSLALGASYTQGSSTVATSAATVNDLSANAAGSYTYVNGWAGTQTPITASGVPANTYGFYDDFVFTIVGSDLDSITSTINLSSGATNTQLVNLDAQLFSVTGNTNLPAFTPSGMVSDLLGVTNFSLTPQVSGTEVVLSPTQSLAAGTYVLQIRGLVNGNAGGSYAGVLDVTPVPLPPGAWLLLGGIAGLGFLCRRGGGAPSRPAF